MYLDILLIYEFNKIWLKVEFSSLALELFLG